jgi:hypothetical protein
VDENSYPVDASDSGIERTNGLAEKSQKETGDTNKITQNK